MMPKSLAYKMFFRPDCLPTAYRFCTMSSDPILFPFLQSPSAPVPP